MSESKDLKTQGHRERLRKRFLTDGLNGFLDYEIVELLLTLGTPRKDCKQMAKDAIQGFKGLRGVLDASLEELQRIKGIGPSNAFGIKLFQAVSEKYAKEKISTKISLISSIEVADFLRQKIGKEKKEHFFILMLDSRNRLIKYMDISIGTLNANLVHPREVFKEVIDNNAASIILAHNHPSDDPEPSPDDIAITRRLEEAARIFDIEILDHIIVTRDNYVSLKEQNLM